MVDAAVGGKTGINTAEGKNLVGAFHEPVGVLCDLDVLATLPPADLRAGLAEVVKCGFIADPRDPRAGRGSSPRRPSTRPRTCCASSIERADRRQGRVVSADLREATSDGRRVGRELLELRPHARPRGRAPRALPLAPRRGGQRRDGLRRRAGPRRPACSTTPIADRHRAVLTSLGLPTTYAPDAFDDLLAAMGLDKKTRGSTLRFVVLNGLASAEILSGPSEELLRGAYAALR